MIRFRTFRSFWQIFILVALAPLVSIRAQEVLLREGETNARAGTFTVPFIFSSDALGASAGVSVGNRGWIQPQASTFLTAVGSAEGSAYGFLALRDLEIPGVERLFVNAQANLGTFSEIDLYQSGNPDFSGERAGSNGSDAENFITGDGRDNAAWLRFLYVMPMGAGGEDPTSTLVLHDGLPVQGRDTSAWNPLRGGYSLVGVKPFYRKQTVTTEETGDDEAATAGAEFLLHYHNTDFADNPSRGSYQQLRYTRDWGTLGSSAPWETVDFEAGKYFALGTGRHTRQRVLALSAWLIDTPSWNDVDVEDGAEVFHRPPAYAGATLGGLERMRGFSEGRYHDRAAAYYAAEYRHIPDWNPLRDAALLRWMHARVDWLQYVAGVEVGRVADDFDLGELHSAMQTSGILGLRAMVNHLVVRADCGISAEGAAVQMTIDQPF